MSSTPAARRPISPAADEPPISRPIDSNQNNAVRLGPRDRVIGQIYIEGDLRVGGIVEGEVEVTGDVAIDDQANVKASVTARDVSISGHVVGAVVARKRLEVTRSGSLIGDVRVARLTIQDGATFSGKVSMGAAAEAPAKAAESKPLAVEPKAIVAEPAVPVAAKSAPVVATPIVSPPAAMAPTVPRPAARPPTVAPPAAKPPTVAPPAAKGAFAAPPAVKAPTVPPPGADTRSDGKGGKAKTAPPKAEPKRR